MVALCKVMLYYSQKERGYEMPELTQTWTLYWHKLYYDIFFSHWKHSTEFVVKRICVRLQSVYRGDLCCHKGKGNLFAVICKASFWIDQPGIHFPSVGNTGPVQKDSCQENVIPSGSADGFFCVPNSCRSLHLTLSCPSATWDRQKVEGKKDTSLSFRNQIVWWHRQKRMQAGRVHIIFRQPNHLAFELRGGKKCEKLPELGVPDTLDQCRVMCGYYGSEAL